MKALATILILLVSLVNIAPVIGVVSSQRLQTFYGVVLGDPNLAILMRHRAVLFGVVGGLLAVSAFHRPLRPAGYAAGFLNMLTFALIAWLVEGYNPEIGRVAVIDLAASLALLVALVLDHIGGGAPRSLTSR